MSELSKVVGIWRQNLTIISRDQPKYQHQHTGSTKIQGDCGSLFCWVRSEWLNSSSRSWRNFVIRQGLMGRPRLSQSQILLVMRQRRLQCKALRLPGWSWRLLRASSTKRSGLFCLNQRLTLRASCPFSSPPRYAHPERVCHYCMRYIVGTFNKTMTQTPNELTIRLFR